MLCEICSSPCFPGARGRKPRFCSSRCRVAAHRRKTIPAELMQLPRWIRHQAKRPMTVNGYWASSTDPNTWSDYQTAKASKHGDGLGFVLNGDGIICIDLDHCLTIVNGKNFLSAGAQSVMDATPDAYVEISPSGTGLHIWGRANLDKGHRFTYMDQAVEIYPNGRYLTMTGNIYRNGGLPELNLNHLLAKTATVNA